MKCLKAFATALSYILKNTFNSNKDHVLLYSSIKSMAFAIILLWQIFFMDVESPQFEMFTVVRISRFKTRLELLLLHILYMLGL